MRRKREQGFILAEIAINTLVSSLVVLGVIALYLPLNRLGQKQQAWLQLTDTATTLTSVLLNELRRGKLSHGGAHGFTVMRGDERRQWRVQKTARKYTNNKRIYALYERVNLKRSQEWVAGVRLLGCHYDVCDQYSNRIDRREKYTPTVHEQLVGMLLEFQLTAQMGLEEPWRIYVRNDV